MVTTRKVYEVASQQEGWCEEVHRTCRTVWTDAIKGCKDIRRKTDSINGKGTMAKVSQMKDISTGLGAHTQDEEHTKSITNVGVKMS